MLVDKLKSKRQNSPRQNKNVKSYYILRTYYHLKNHRNQCDRPCIGIILLVKYYNECYI